MGQSAVVDEEAMEACLKEVTKALLEVRCSVCKRAGPLRSMPAPVCAVLRSCARLARLRAVASRY